MHPLKHTLNYLGLTTLLIVLIGISLSVGSIDIPINKLYTLLQNYDSSLDSMILQTVRIPRTLCAIIVGAALALSGVILHYIIRNDLACPSILGINQGVYLGFVLSTVLNYGSSIGVLFSGGILMGALAGLTTYYLTYVISFSPLKLILVGQTINLFCYALSQLLLMLCPNQSDVLLSSLGGTLANGSWLMVNTFALILLIAIVTTLVFIKKNYLLSLGEEMGKSIGMNVGGYLVLFLVLLLVMCTCSVAIVGPLLFFSLVSVQCSRLFVSPNQPYHFAIVNILVGSILLISSDILIRSLYTDWEAPLNIFIAIISVPILIIRARSMR